ncbi:MAG: hypothetical protein AAF431_12900 [Pseudomonadota bacterium]
MIETLLKILGGKQNEQSDSEALIKIATFFCMIDSRITLEEQEHIKKLMDALEWEPDVDVEVFQENIITEVNRVLDGSPEYYNSYLAEVMDNIKSEEVIAKAKEIAKAMTDADGVLADEEANSLDFISAY